MSAIEDIKNEIIRSHQVPVPESSQEKPPKKPKGEKKAMTKAEIEAYRQKMMEREEARYLGKQPKKREKSEKSGKAGKSGKSGKTRTEGPKPRKESDAKTEEKVQKVQKVKKVQKPPVQTAKMPKILKPLVPLYLLRIPGLPKGDCLAICYAEGADA